MRGLGHQALCLIGRHFGIGRDVHELYTEKVYRQQDHPRNQGNISTRRAAEGGERRYSPGYEVATRSLRSADPKL